MVDSKICPFCKNENRCEAHIPNNDCWCNHIKVPIELREFIAPEFRMKACICKECVTLFKENKEKFLEKFSKLT